MNAERIKAAEDMRERAARLFDDLASLSEQYGTPEMVETYKDYASAIRALPAVVE